MKLLVVEELESADSVHVTSLVDGYTNLVLTSEGKVERPPLGKDEKILPPLVAEHGFSALVEVSVQGEDHAVLFDGGASETAIIHNAKRLGIDLHKVEAVVLSHGHYDHFGGLVSALGEISRKDVPLILHPDALLQRWLILRNRNKFKLPVFNENLAKAAGARTIKNTRPCWIGGDTILVSGEIARRTDFERGLPDSYAERAEGLRKDPEISDEQSLTVHVRRKGLIVISGCGHAGIINTLMQAQESTKVRNVQAVLGGFHLTGPAFANVVKNTVKELVKMSPRIVAPSHCTGCQATYAIMRAMPKSYVQNSVGSQLCF